MNSFDAFGLAAPITRALVQENYTTPTPIQAQAIPLVLEGRDLTGIAQTGTGKTAAFALPILNRLAANPRAPEKKTCRVLVLSPTRELSNQILDSFRTYGRYMPLRSTLVIGGVSMGKQVRAVMGGLDVLVATPGRLLDLVRGNALRLNQVEVLVLDEADRMLDMGFIHDIRTIVAKLPRERQTLLFSATMPREIAELASQMLRDPVQVAVTPAASTADRIAQRVIHTARAGKTSLLVDTLRTETIDRALIFTRTKHGADKVVRGLNQAGIAADAIHGNKSQNARERVLADFRNGKLRTLVATDIAARGIDVTEITHVINYDLPNVPETYVHRIGRTARAGAEGIAISFCDADEAPFLRDIEKLIRMQIPATGEAAAQQPGQRAPGRPGQRPSRGRNNNRGHGHAPRSGDQRGDHAPRHAAGAGQNGESRNGRDHTRNATGDRNGRDQARNANGENRNGSNHTRNANGESRNGGDQPRANNGSKRKGRDNAGRRNGENRNGGRDQAPRQAGPAHDGEIGTVSFMQRKQTPRHTTAD